MQSMRQMNRNVFTRYQLHVAKIDHPPLATCSKMHVANAFFFVLFDYELHVAKSGWSILATCN